MRRVKFFRSYRKGYEKRHRLSVGTENIILFFAETLNIEFLRERKCTTYYVERLNKQLGKKIKKSKTLIVRTVLTGMRHIYTLYSFPQVKSMSKKDRNFTYGKNK